MLSMTLLGFGSDPILAKVTLLEKQTRSPKVMRLFKNLMIKINIFKLEIYTDLLQNQIMCYYSTA